MKLTESSLRQLIRQVIREADESDKYTHIGYGKYREKGKEKDKDAQTFKKTDSGKFEPAGGDAGGEKDKPKPKVTKIAADPFADKDSETGKDYTRKFMGTDEPKEFDNATDLFAKKAEENKDNKYWGSMYDKLSKSEDWESALKIMGKTDFYNNKGRTAAVLKQAGVDQTTLHSIYGMKPFQAMDDHKPPDDYLDWQKSRKSTSKDTADKPEPQPSGDETEIEKVLNTVWGPGGFEGTEDDTFEAIDLLRDKGISDEDIRGWLDTEFDASEQDIEYWMTGDEDVYDESVVNKLKEEFKQYGFAQKSKNWKHAL